MGVIFKRKVMKSGNSLYVCIPEEIIKQLKIKKGDIVNIELEDKKVIIYE